MSFSSVGTYACRALQAKLIDYFGANTAEAKKTGSVAFIRWLLSPQNTSGFNQIADGITTTIPGKKRAVAFQVDTPFCYDVCAISNVDCETERVALDQPSQEIVFTLDGPAFRPCDANGDPLRLEFEQSELDKYCTESDTSYITRQIARFNRRFLEALDKRLAEIAETLVGQNADGASITRIPFFINTSIGVQTINPEAFWYLDQLYRDIAGEGQYGLVGGKVLNKIIAFQKWAGLSDAGIDLSEIDDVNPYTYYDKNFDASLGINQFLQLSPGALQLVTFNENKGDRRRVVTDLYTHSTFIDPATGLEVDFEWYFEPKCKKWTYEPLLYAELAAARPGGCDIEGANGILLIEDCSSGATPPECPES